MKEREGKEKLRRKRKTQGLRHDWALRPRAVSAHKAAFQRGAGHRLTPACRDIHEADTQADWNVRCATKSFLGSILGISISDPFQKPQLSGSGTWKFLISIITPKSCSSTSRPPVKSFNCEMGRHVFWHKLFQH